MREGRPEAGGLGRDIRLAVEERVAERALEAGRDLAPDLLASGRRGEPVELVEQARHGVGLVGLEVDGGVRLRAQEEEPELLRRDDLDDLVGGGAAALGRRHLLAADVDELVRDVQRRLALEDLAGDRVGAITRAARGREVLAARLDRDAEERPLGRPLQVPRELCPAAERRDPARVTASARPRDEGLAALVEHPLAIPLGDDRRPDLAAALADDVDRVPVVGMLDVRDTAVDVADDLGPIEGGSDVAVHVAGRVDVAHPVVALGHDPEAAERLDEDAREVPGIARVAVAGRVRNVGQRAAHLAVDRVVGQERLGVHRVEVVDAVEQAGFDAAGAKGTPDGVEDDRPAKRADMDGTRRRLAVVDDLRSADAGGELVGPVHVLPPRDAGPGGPGEPRGSVAAS